MPYMSGAHFSDMPPWMKEPYKELVSETMARTTGGTPPTEGGAAAAAAAPAHYRRPGLHEYVPYPNTRIAPISEDIKRSHEMARQNLGAYLPYLRGAAESVGAGMGHFPQQAHEYMNPYQKHVISGIAEEGNRNFKENIMPALEAKFVRLGQHGSSRHADLARRAAKDTQAEISKRQHEAMAHGYQHAAAVHNADMLRRLEGANSLGKMGALHQAGLLADLAALENQGRYQQDQQQANLDVDYQNFMRELEHPMQRLAFLSSILHGIPVQQANQYYHHRPHEPEMNSSGRLAALAANIWGSKMMGGR